MNIHKLLSLHIKDKYDKIHILKYSLMNTPIVSKYLDMLEENRAIANGNIDSNFNNAVESDYPELSDKIKILVKSINEYNPVFNLPEYDTIQQDELNRLHELFEEWGGTPDQSDRKLAKMFFMLNDLIHACEDTFASGRVMGAVVDVKPSIESGRSGIHSTISNKDRLSLTSRYTWGSLYLGYNTLGKDYLAAMKDNDIRLIENDEVRPQKRFAAEIWLNMGYDQRDSSKIQFGNWIETLDDEVRRKIPLHNQQELSLGRFILGHLIIDEQFYKMDPNLDHWNVDNHYCKLRYNKEVFSTFREVVDIRVDEQWPPQEIVDFAKKNKKEQWMPDGELPPNVWNSDWPWAPLFVDFNERRVREELEQIDSLFVPHRDKDGSGGYGHLGWNGVTLHGIGPTKTQNYEQYGYKTQEEADYHWTSICRKCPYIVDTIKSLPFSKFDRVRIMRLSPGGYIMPHKDGEGRIFGPLNIALTQPEGCEFIFEGRGVVPFETGRGFMLDLGRRHSVINYTDEYRYHIIVHGTPNSQVGVHMKRSMEQL